MDVKNRIMISAQSQFYGEQGVISDRHVAFYRERAQGGVGLLVLEAQAVHPAVRHYHAVVYPVFGGKPETLQIDSLVLALSREPNDALYRELKSAEINVHRVGDVVAPRSLEAVIYEGERLGRAI